MNGYDLKDITIEALESETVTFCNNPEEPDCVHTFPTSFGAKIDVENSEALIDVGEPNQ